MIGTYEVIWRLLAAAVFGGVIGVNRSRLDWAAGMRTHMLVSVGAALTVIVSAYGFQHALGYPHVVLDPSRIAAQVVSGIGFLGAGTILFLEREQAIKGLTTAAGLWAVAAVGLASGAGLFIPALAATALLWGILALLKPLERRFVKPRRTYASLIAELDQATSIAAVEQALAPLDIPVRQIRLRRMDAGKNVVEIRFAPGVTSGRLGQIVDACQAIEGVRAVHLRPSG